MLESGPGSRLVRALWAMLSMSIVAGCTVESACLETDAPSCIDGRMVSTCVEGNPVVTECGDGLTCIESLGCTRCAPGTIECALDGEQVLVCGEDGAGFEPDELCAAGEQCVPGLGCAGCVPSETRCDGETLSACRADGTGSDVVEVCDPDEGFVCRAGAASCVPADTLCGLVEADHSNLGCDFWSAPLASCGSPLDRSFTLLIANPYPVPTTVTFERNGLEAHAPRELPALGSAVVQLPCVATPREPGLYTYSAIRRGGAYRVRSTIPISLVQLQPTEDMSVVADDFLQLGDGALVMPARAASCSSAVPCDFYAMSTTTWLSYQGSLAIVGTDDHPVNVTVRLKAPISPSIDGFTGRPDSIALSFDGEELSFALAPGDVVELMTQIPASGFYFNLFHDLTGTRVRADGSIAVISGSMVGFVPVGASVPNAIGESMPPTSAWGLEHVVARPRPLAGEPYVVKVLAAMSDTYVSFEPELYPTRRLRAGQSFEILAQSDVVVRSSQPVLVAQLTVGSSLYAPSAEAEGRGGPAMTLVPSVERGSTDISFAAMPSVASGLSIGALQSADVTLDGRRIQLVPIEGTEYGVSRVTLGAGTHRLRSTTPVVGSVHGVGLNGAFLVPIVTTYPAGLE